ncbi:MAG: cupin domain-containing protein, partial [Bacillota bacterium]
MIETVYQFTRESSERLIERIIDDRNVAINHMILPKGSALPPHPANSNVYMIIVRGTMSITLIDQETQEHSAGEIINIPFLTQMDVRNNHEEVLEFFVVKAPNPRDMM